MLGSTTLLRSGVGAQVHPRRELRRGAAAKIGRAVGPYAIDADHAGILVARGGRSEWVLQRIVAQASHEMVERYMHVADTGVTQLHRRHSPLDRL